MTFYHFSYEKQESQKTAVQKIPDFGEIENEIEIEDRRLRSKMNSDYVNDDDDDAEDFELNPSDFIQEDEEYLEDSGKRRRIAVGIEHEDTLSM